jgi:hypothetical protein
MFDPTSRYYSLQTATLTFTGSDGVTRLIAYKRRRFIPSQEGSTTLLEHSVTQSDRLDNLTAQYLGDPLQFWRVCDANLVLHPGELTEEIGQVVKINLPKI